MNSTPKLSRLSPPAHELPVPAERAWPKRVLLLAAAWNILGGASALLNPTGNLEQMFIGAGSTTDPRLLFFFQCTWINVIAWGAGYLFAAFRPASRAALLLAGAAGKLAYFAASVLLFAGGAGTIGGFVAGCVDAMLALAFLAILGREHAFAGWSVPTHRRPALPEAVS